MTIQNDKGRKQLSHPNDNLLSELSILQTRLDEIRVMLREEIANEALPDETFQILICRTDLEIVGILVTTIEEVVHVCQLTKVPDAAPWFSGLLNIGGEMVSVLDLATKISGVKHDTALTDLIIICQTSNGRTGVVVNEIDGIHQLAKADVQTVSGSLAGAPYLLGAAEIDARTVLLLNIPGLSSSASLSKKVSQ